MKARRRTLGRRGTHPVDAHVGSRVRLRRNMLGLSRERLGEALGLTFQQVQKYERGSNRISASRLFELCQILGVPAAFFYDDSDPVHAPAIEEPPASTSPFAAASEPLIEAYRAIADPAVRRSLTALAKALAEPREAAR